MLGSLIVKSQWFLLLAVVISLSIKKDNDTHKNDDFL